MASPKKKWVWWVAGSLFIYVVFGNKGARDLTVRFNEKRRLEKSLVRLRKDNERLTRELAWIKQDPTYTEYLIRKNLGYVKKGEVEYQFGMEEEGSRGK